MLRRKRKSLAIEEEDNQQKPTTTNQFVSPVRKKSNRELPEDNQVTSSNHKFASPVRRKQNGSPLKKPRRIKDNVDEESIFCQMVTQAGGKLQNDGAHLLDVDQAIFQRDLKDLLKKHGRFPVILDDFFESMKVYASDTLKLECLLMPTEPSPQCKSSRGGEQDSLLRLLIGVDILQASFVPWLLEKVAEFSLLQNGSGSGTNIPILILSQLRWLGVLVDSKGLADKMLEILPVLPLDLQKKLIVLFPEILHDSEHSEIAKKLSEMMMENKNLIMVIADSLSTLNVQAEDIVEVKLSVLNLLQTVPTEELPTLINFLLNNLPSDQAATVISELRVKLDLITSLIPLSTSTPAVKNASLANNARNSAVPIMEACLSACRWQKSICESWIKVIEKNVSTKDHLPIDLSMIFLLYSLEPGRKTLEGIIRNKIRAGHFNTALLNTTLQTHSKVMKERFTCVLRLANVLLRSYEPLVCKFGSVIYQGLFVALDKYCQQEVIGQLMTHVGSRVPSEIDAALDILSNLVKSNKGEVAPFATFLKSLLDYLDLLSLDQIRVVYSLLSELAYKTGPEGALIQDELRIVIRKQVTHSNLKYMRMGVVGALMAAKAMCVPRNNDTTRSRFSTIFSDSVNKRLDVAGSSNASSCLSLERTYSQETIQLLDLVKKCCAAYGETTALFYDELSRLIQKGWLDDKVEVWINDIMLSSFQEDFITDVSPDTEFGSAEGVDLELRQSQDGPMSSEVALNLAPCLVADGTAQSAQQRKNAGKASAVILAAQFRLLRICEFCQSNGVLDEIDILALCPVVMPRLADRSVFSKHSTATKSFICLSVVHCLNWLRELVNAFVGQADKQIKIGVVQHLRHIIRLQDLLLEYVPDTPEFAFPVAVFDQPEFQLPAVKPKAKSTTAKKPKAIKGKRKKKDEEEKTSQTQRSQKNNGNSPQTQKTDGKPTESKQALSDLSSFRTSFRELDLEVFILLQNGLEIPTDSQRPEKESLKLGPAELLFLLEDLYSKVDHSLPSSNTKRFSILKARFSKTAGFSNLSLYTTQEIARAVVNILASLRSLLEDCKTHFQNVLTKNDGIFDGPGMDSKESTALGSSMTILFRIINTAISWCGFQDVEFSDLFMEAISSLCSSCPSSMLDSQDSLRERIREAFDYFVTYEECLPSVECAVAQIRLLETLASQPQMERSLQHQTSKLAKTFLTKSWPNQENIKGSKHNEHIQTLLGVYIGNGEHGMKILQDVCSKAITESIQADNQGFSSESYPTLNKHTFGTYHRMVLQHLSEIVKNIDCDQDSEIINQWEMAVNIFHIVINIVKVFGTRNYLSSCLKFGHVFVENFNKKCMPILDTQFSHKTETVMQLIKALQMSTRNMQHICGHAKAQKDVSLTRYVPAVKKTLETFVFRVKQMLARNNCKEAFWMGVLKNRDLHGEEILSQVVNESDEDEEGETAEEEENREDDGEENAKTDEENEREEDAEGSDEY